MKTQATLLALALVTALAASPVQALVINTPTVLFNNGTSISDTEGGGTTTVTNAPLGTSLISQFNPTSGVLTGATLNLTSVRSISAQVNSTDGTNTGNNNSVTSNGTGSSNARISAPGVTANFAAITQAASCTGPRQEGCTGPYTLNDLNATNASSNVSSGSLNDYVGAGNVTVTRTAPTLTANQQSNQFTGAESTIVQAGWRGSLSASYTYLLHAAPSFDGSSLLTLDLDFGTVFVGSMADLSFNIFNNAGDRVGLDLVGLSSGTGHTSMLTTDLALFDGLGAGLNNMFLASLDTSSSGNYVASYLLTFADDATVGASNSRTGGYVLELKLTGNVVDRQTVPEPGMLALLGIGLLGLGMSRRKLR